MPKDHKGFRFRDARGMESGMKIAAVWSGSARDRWGHRLVKPTEGASESFAS